MLPSGQRTAFQPAQIVEHTPNQVTVAVDLNHSGYLVVTDVWYPGWRATVDGKPAPVLRANVAFRAIALAEGNLQYSDTPTQPLVPLQYTDDKAEPGKSRTYRVIVVNTACLRSLPPENARK